MKVKYFNNAIMMKMDMFGKLTVFTMTCHCRISRGLRIYFLNRKNCVLQKKKKRSMSICKYLGESLWINFLNRAFLLIDFLGKVFFNFICVFKDKLFCMFSNQCFMNHWIEVIKEWGTLIHKNMSKFNLSSLIKIQDHVSHFK